MELNLENLRAFGSISAAIFPESKEHPYGFSKWEINIHVSFKKGEIQTYFRVYPKSFSEWKDCLYECNSYQELKTWLEEHSEEIQ